MQPEFDPCPVCLQNRVVELGLFSGSPATVDAVRIGRIQPPDGFKDVLRRIDKNSPGSKIGETSRYI
jgi:hypothetical protein